MTADASWPVQQAIFAALAVDATLTALLADGADSIFDDVPEREAFPYLTIGDIQSSAADTKTEGGQEHTATLNVWTKRSSRTATETGHEGRKQARLILDAAIAVLNHATLTVTGFVNTGTYYLFSDVYRDDDNTYHGVARFRVVTEPA